MIGSDDIRLEDESFEQVQLNHNARSSLVRHAEELMLATQTSNKGSSIFMLEQPQISVLKMRENQ